VTEPHALDHPEAGGRALRGGTARTAGFLVGMGLLAAATPLVIRHLGLVEYGRYVTILTIVTLAGGLTELGINQLAVRELSADAGPAERERVLRLLYGLRVVSGTVTVLVAVGVCALAGYDTSLLGGAALAGLGLIVGGVQALFGTALQADLRLGALAFLEAGRQALSALLLVVLVLAGAGVVPFLAVQLPAAGLALVAAAWLVRGRFPWRPSFRMLSAWPLVRETAAYAAAVALGIVYFRVATAAMPFLSTDVETGYFATSFRVIEILTAFPPLLIGAAFPILARSATTDAARFDAATRRIVELALQAGIALGLAVALAAPAIVQVLVGHGVPEVEDALRIQSIGLACTFVASAVGYALLSLKLYRTLLVREATALLVVLAGLALIPSLGADGAAIAATAAEAALAIASLVALRRLRPAATGIGGVPVTLAALSVGGGLALLSGLPALAATVLALLVYGGILALAGRFPAELKALLPGR
jgi:O-antigen/teichoic acid export membrane protein